MKILISALEHSANIHLKEIIDRSPNSVEISGIFSSELGNPIVDMRSVSIMGISDAVKKIRFFLNLANEMVELSKDADKVLLIDSSGFNLPLAKKIKKRYPNKEIIYYILPQAWAWRRSRIPKLIKYTDKLCSILPFEKKFYPKDANIEYIGHPLLDEIKLFKDSLPQDIKKVAFLPGSRKREISSLMPIYKRVREKLKDIEAIIAIPSYFSKDEIKELYGDLEGFKIYSDAHQAIYDSDFAFICSGTATLEASLIGTPFILSYIAGKFDYMIGRRLVKIERIGLANIFFQDFANRDMHPELVQYSVSEDNLLKLFNSFDMSRFIDDSKRLRDYLSNGSADNMKKILSH